MLTLHALTFSHAPTSGFSCDETPARLLRNAGAGGVREEPVAPYSTRWKVLRLGMCTGLEIRSRVQGCILRTWRSGEEIVMKRLCAAVMLLATLALAGCGPSSADTGKMNAALGSLSRLQSKVEAGVVYADYSKAVGDTKGTVDLFTESSAAKSYPAIATETARAMRAYVGASTIWNAKIQDTNNSTPMVADMGSWPTLVEEFPALKDDLTTVSVLGVDDQTTEEPAVLADKAVQTLWSAADQAIAKAKASAAK